MPKSRKRRFPFPTIKKVTSVVEIVDDQSNASDAEGFGCSVCALSHKTEACPVIKGGVRIEDTPVPKRAFLTLPLNLEIKTLPGEEGSYTSDVVCKTMLAKGTQFGPLEAPKSLLKYNNANESGYVLRVFEVNGRSSFLDTTDLERCNWMSLVRFTAADDGKKPNCLCYQLKNAIYFTVIKNISPGEALIVGYAPGYKARLEKVTFPSRQKHLTEPEPDQHKKTSSSPTKRGLHSMEDESLDPSTRNRDHDYITSAGLKTKEEEVSQCEDQKIEQGTPEIHNIVGETRKSLRKRKPNTKNDIWDPEVKKELLSENEGEDDQTPAESASKLPKTKRDRLKPIKVIRMVEKWVCKFCHKTVPTVEMFASHLIDHYKSVGWAGAVSDTDRLETIQKTDSVNSERSVSKPSLMEVSEGDVKLPVEPSHPYTCDICMHSKEFDKIEYVIRHLNNHVAELTSTRIPNENSKTNEEVGQLSRSCSHCNKTFYSTKRLNSHELVNHGKWARCKRCRKVFNSDQDLKFHACKHFRIGGGDEISALLQCDVCEETFSRTAAFEKHASSHDPSSFACKICLKGVTNETRKLHLIICELVQKFKSFECEELQCPCLRCEKTFRSLEEFQEHVLSHTHTFMCQTCKMRFRNLDDIQLHICSEVVCDECNEPFSSLETLFTHIKEIHEGPTAFCFECAFPFSTKDGYLLHGDCEYQHDLFMKAYDPSEPLKPAGSYICESCGATYNNWSSMKTHRKTHGPRKFVCNQCGKSFHRKELLADHINVHEEAKFECTRCGKMFKSHKSLEVHMRIHNGVKPYSCSTCGKAFTQRVNLRSHEMTHLPIDLKTFACPYEDCDKKFSSKEYLKFHIETHENGKNYSCDVCGKQFIRPYMLNRHKRTSHGSHKYKCEFCDPPLYLRQKHNLFRHLQRKHEDFKERWSQEGYVHEVFIPGDGTFSHPSAKARLPIRDPSVPRPEESEQAILHQIQDNNILLSQADGMTVMISGSIHDVEGDIEIDTEEVVIGPDHSNEVQILDYSEQHSTQHHQHIETQGHHHGMVLLQLDNSGSYVIAFPNTVEDSVEFIGAMDHQNQQ